jgi:hypothetical protein
VTGATERLQVVHIKRQDGVLVDLYVVVDNQMLRGPTNPAAVAITLER